MESQHWNPDKLNFQEVFENIFSNNSNPSNPLSPSSTSQANPEEKDGPTVPEPIRSFQHGHRQLEAGEAKDKFIKITALTGTT